MIMRMNFSCPNVLVLRFSLMAPLSMCHEPERDKEGEERENGVVKMLHFVLLLSPPPFFLNFGHSKRTTQSEHWRHREATRRTTWHFLGKQRMSPAPRMV